MIRKTKINHTFECELEHQPRMTSRGMMVMGFVSILLLGTMNYGLSLCVRYDLQYKFSEGMTVVAENAENKIHWIQPLAMTAFFIGLGCLWILIGLMTLSDCMGPMVDEVRMKILRAAQIQKSWALFCMTLLPYSPEIHCDCDR